MRQYLSIVFWMLYFIIVIYIFTKTFEYSFSKIIGFALVLTGSFIVIIAKHQLGDSWAVLPKAKKLVTEGIYSKIRHPIYSGFSLILLGATIYFKSVIWFVVFILTTILDIYRAKKEEQILEKKFGKTYREYKKKSRF